MIDPQELEKWELQCKKHQDYKCGCYHGDPDCDEWQKHIPRLIAAVRKLNQPDKFDKTAKPLADVFEEIMAEKDMTNCISCGEEYDNHDTVDICDPCVIKLRETTGYEVAAKWRNKYNKFRKALEFYRNECHWCCGRGTLGRGMAGGDVEVPDRECNFCKVAREALDKS